MNPLFSLFLFGMSLLAIAAACALLLYIVNELNHNRAVAQREQQLDETTRTEARAVTSFLSRMKASTSMTAPKPSNKSNKSDGD